MYLDPDDGTFGLPVSLVSSADSDIVNVNASYVDERLVLTYNSTEVSYDGELSVSSALMQTRIDGSDAVDLSEISVDYDKLTAGEKSPVDLLVKNNSDSKANGFRVDFINKNGEVFDSVNVDCVLGSGESKWVSVEFTVPETLDASELRAAVISENGSSSVMSFSLGQCDLAVTAAQTRIGDRDGVEVNITNNGEFASAGRLQVLNDKGEVLDHRDFLPVSKGRTVTFRISDIERYLGENNELVFSLISIADHYNSYNDSVRIIIYDYSGKTPFYGDIDGDGVISIDDATLIQMYIADLREFTPNQKLIADVNLDGGIDITDVTLIQMYIADLIPSLGQELKQPKV